MSFISTPALPELVWIKGISACCTWRFPDEFPDGYYVRQPTLASGQANGGSGHSLTSETPADLILDPEAWREVPEGALIWVRLSWLRSFVRQILPQLRSPFLLVTGDSISAVPSQVPGDILSALLEHTNILHWFAQNCDNSHPRISRLPLGIDFHTINDRPYWGEQQAAPSEQERQLKCILRELPPVERRIPNMYLDFAWQQVDYGGRLRTVEDLRSNPRAFLQTAPMSRGKMWRQRGEFAFVVSPRGYGLDCHRTWEALALGHIVLVPASPLDALYEGLAVVPISDWSQVTPDDLSRWLQTHGCLTRENPRLTSAWWVERMRASGLFTVSSSYS